MASKKFALYSGGNSYISPYGSAKNGGELVTEFNQRAPFNVIGWKLIDLNDTEIWVNPELKPIEGLSSGQYYSWMSGVLDDNPGIRGNSDVENQRTLNLSIQGSELQIGAGKALICGYFGDFEEIRIPTEDIISITDMGVDRPEGFTLTKYVKLEIVTTQSTNNAHDERLVPPLADQYLGIDIIVDDTLPQLNQLLLGTITRDLNGTFTVVNNPLKSRFISIEHISGAENYHNLVEVPETEGIIYGVQKGATDGNKITNLTNINEWTWLAYNSVLGKFIRNLAKNPDDMGKPGGIMGSTNGDMLGLMIGWANPQKLPALSDNEVKELADGVDIEPNKLIQLHLGPKPYLRYRTLNQGIKQPDCYDTEIVRFPFANYTNRGVSDTVRKPIGGVSGIVSPETLWQIDTLWEDRESLNVGRQWGPFLNIDVAKSWFKDNPITPQIFDYFWVLNDTIQNDDNGDGKVTEDGATLEVDYGEVTGTYTAKTSGQVTAKFDALDLTGTEITGTAEGTLQTAEGENVPVTGPVTITGATSVKVNEVTGTATGEGSGTVKMKLTSFVQNVSARYIYLPDYPKDYYRNKATYPAQYDSKKKTGGFSWKKEAVMRGFACPATPQYYGFVRPSSGTEIGDVINDPDTNQLRLDTVGRQLLQNGGWKYSIDTAIKLNPSSESDFARLENTWFLSDQVTIYLEGDGWDSTSVPQIHRIRGNITLDISKAVLSEGATALVDCVDINTLTIEPRKSSNGVFTGEITDAKINTKDCVLTTHYFNSIYHWQNTVFDSGSNTALVNNPWMTVPSAFSQEYENSLQVRFVSVTRGEYEVETAELDIWIKREDWTKPGGFDDFSMVTRQKLKFPPLLMRLNDAGNIIERQDIDSALNAKVSGTGGTHRSWDSKTSGYIMTGNWISTIDWENGEELSVNGRMLSPATTTDKIHGLYDVRFRALVQFTHTDDMMEQSVDYSIVHQN